MNDRPWPVVHVLVQLLTIRTHAQVVVLCAPYVLYALVDFLNALAAILHLSKLPQADAHIRPVVAALAVLVVLAYLEFLAFPDSDSDSIS